jgi:anti-sigma B factor antagonist
MNIKQRSVNGIEFLEPEGKITMGEGDLAIRARVDELLKQGKNNIVLDLANVPYIDSAGLGQIIRCYTTTRKSGGELKLLNPNKKIVDLLAVTKLVSVFDWYDSEEKVLHSFATGTRSRTAKP